MIRRLCLTLLFTSFLFAGCTLVGRGLLCGLRIYMDQPMLETRAVVGMPVAVMGHSNMLDETSTEINLVIREEQDTFPYEYDSIPMDQILAAPGLWEFTTLWVPQTAGTHQIHMISNSLCDWSPVLSIEVEEGGRGGAVDEATPTAMATAVLPTAMPLVMSIQLWSDASEIISGGCTRLHWDVSHADRVYLDGELIPASGTQEVCPVSTTTYTVRAEGASGITEKSLAINVGAAPAIPPQQLTFLPPTVVVQPPLVTAQPSDSSGPQITSVNHSPALIFDNPACGTAEVQISARIEDPSGISVAEVYYRVYQGTQQGAWRIVPMTAVGGGEYRAVLGQTQFKLSHPDFFNGTVEYQVKARDNRNNGSESAVEQFEVQVCIN